MILDRVTFSYHDQILIEKFKIMPPYKYEATFQNRGCFIYFKEQGPQLYSSADNTKLDSQQAVLLKCGNHFLELLKEKEDQEVEVIVVHFFPSVLKELYIAELPKLLEKQSNAAPSQVIASNDVIAKFIESLEFYFQNPTLVNNDLLELKIKELVLLLVQSKYVNSVAALINDLYSTKRSHFKEVVKLHLFSNLSLEELAQLCHFSLSSFKREFKKEFDDSPTNYFNARKIEKAKELLQFTSLAINEIAYETGFNDPYYFTRLFKNKVGISPSHFKEKHSS